MEQEPRPATPKLIEIARRDFPEASNILVSFPSQWEHVETIPSNDHPLYVAGFPIERSYTSRHHFAGLSPEINVSLVFYRLYKFFQPWPLPTVTVDWNPRSRRGQVTDRGDVKLQLQPVGQAQAWFGVSDGLLWECFLDQPQRRANWQDTLEKVWGSVEKDIGTRRIFTLPHEPAFQGNYKEYLERLGYEADPQNVKWWSKTIQRERSSIMPQNE